MKRKGGLGLVVIDYLQLVQPDDPRDPRQEQVAKMARRLKCMARELLVPVLCLAQLNRQADPGSVAPRHGQQQDSSDVPSRHLPRLSHLRESGAIEQDADVVMFIHREEAYHTREEAESQGLVGVAHLSVAKQRNGPTGLVRLTWEDKFTRFDNYMQGSDEDFSTYSDDYSSFDDAEVGFP